jgi:hypothetical protein
MINPLSTWKSTLKDLPKVGDPSWSFTFANWYAQRITTIAPDPSMLTAVGFIFLFPLPIFAGALVSIPPSSDATVAIKGFADAWETAIKTIVYPAGLFLGPGTVFGAPTPATTFSSVSSVIINPASIILGKAKIMELASVAPTKDGESPFPQKFRDATLQLKIDITGINSVVPTPAPLLATGISLI